MRQRSVSWPPARQKCAALRLLATKTCVRGRYCGASTSRSRPDLREGSVFWGLVSTRRSQPSLPPFGPPTSAPCTLPGDRNGPKLAAEVGINDLSLHQGSVFSTDFCARGRYSLRRGSVCRYSRPIFARGVGNHYSGSLASWSTSRSSPRGGSWRPSDSHRAHCGPVRCWRSRERR